MNSANVETKTGKINKYNRIHVNIWSACKSIRRGRALILFCIGSEAFRVSLLICIILVSMKCFRCELVNGHNYYVFSMMMIFDRMRNKKKTDGTNGNEYCHNWVQLGCVGSATIIFICCFRTVIATLQKWNIKITRYIFTGGSWWAGIVNVWILIPV